ncbi:MAG: TonB-dependent receptor, partial [Phycisphaerae bacterium]|nr:TonB-dependent receptor [Phycisphaerae bacterium]
TVSIAEIQDLQVTTGEQGSYNIPDVPPGQYTLVIRKDGYARRVLSEVVVTPDAVTERNVRLSGEFTEMDAFVVQDVRIGGPTEVGLLELRAVSPQFLDSVGSDFLSRAGASDAAQGLRLVSGATTTRGNFAAVRGLPPRFVSTQLNGFMLPSADPDTRAVQLDLFPAEVIESIQVSKTFTPDQQGMASGGAVNIVTKSIPEKNFIKFSSKIEVNTQRPENGEFLADTRGEMDYFGSDPDRDLPDGLKQKISSPALDVTRFGAAGPEFSDAPVQYDWGMTGGLRYDLADGVSIGGLGAFFWDQGVGHDENGVDEQRVRSTAMPGEGLIPAASGSDALGFLQEPQDGEQVLTNLFEVRQSEHEVTWGGLATVGLESEDHRVGITFMHTRVTSATSTIKEDTQGKFLKFPGHEPFEVSTPGGANAPGGAGDLRSFAPFRRFETQEYVERTVQSLQFSGEHTLPVQALKDGLGVEGIFEALAPQMDWHVASSLSRREQPGTTIFDAKYLSANEGVDPIFPGAPPIASPAPDGEHVPVGFPNSPNLGSFNVIFRDIEESSTQYRLNFELPFRQWSGDEGYVRLGIFDDATTREFAQDTFTGAKSGDFILNGAFDAVRLSEAFSEPEAFDGQFAFNSFPFPPHPITELNDPGELEPAPTDFRYTGEQSIDAWYWMVDLPLTSFVKVVGGLRFENTRLTTDISADAPTTAVLLDGPVLESIGATAGVPVELSFVEGELGVEGINANLVQEDVLPSLGVVVTPLDSLTIRAAYSETVARPTFRELTPVSQPLFAGDTPFVGNPFLTMSAVDNYDLRVDYRPFRDSLISLSYFRKDVENPIQVVQQAQGQTNIVIPVNFPDGRIEGWEFEVRQNLGRFHDRLDGLMVGGNLTLLDTEVTMRQFEAEQLAAADVPVRTIPMTNAPEHLYNLFLTYDYRDTGTQLSLFYTVRGDTLIASPGSNKVVGGDPQFTVPAVYEKQFDTLNLTISQKIGEHISAKFSAKNLTNSKRQTVYRADYLDGDVVRTSNTDGVDLSVSISANFEF